MSLEFQKGHFMRPVTESVRRFLFMRSNLLSVLIAFPGAIGAVLLGFEAGEAVDTMLPIAPALLAGFMTFMGVMVATFFALLPFLTRMDDRNALRTFVERNYPGSSRKHQADVVWLIREAFRTRSALAPNHDPDALQYASVVIDGGSSDTYVMIIRKKYSDAGFVDGNSYSIERRSEPFAITYNSDPDAVFPGRLRWTEYREAAEELERAACPASDSVELTPREQKQLDRKNRRAQQQFRELITSD